MRVLYDRLRLICADLPGNSENWLDCEEIKGGDDWERTTMQAMEDANVFIVGMSTNYLTSPFCMEREFKRVMTLCQQRRAKVIGVYLREVAKLGSFAVSLDDGSRPGLAERQCLPVAERDVEGVRKFALRPIEDWPSGKREVGWSKLQSQLEKALRDDSAATHVIVGTAAGAPQEASAPIASPAAVPAGLQLAAKALPYLADRDDQSYFLHKSIQPWTNGGCKRPLLVLSEGRHADCLPKWVERLHSRELVMGFGPQAQAQSFGEPKSFHWPSANVPQPTTDDARDYFQNVIGVSLVASGNIGFEELVADYLQRQRATLMWTTCPDRSDPAHATRALAGLLQLLRAWPDLTPASMLVLSINLGRDADAPPGKRARLGPAFEQALLQAQAEGRIHAAVLGSLPELDHDAIQRWAQEHARQHLTDDITLLCANGLPPSATETWPMLTFAVVASKWLARA